MDRNQNNMTTESRMKLHWSPRSPFVRKVMIALHEAELVDQVTCVRSVVASMAIPNDTILADNPLGQIPTLVPQQGPPLYDSRVICEYIDGLTTKSNLFPVKSKDRFWQLHWQALGDGLAANLIALRTERLRESSGVKAMREALETKSRACVGALSSELAQLQISAFGIGHIAIACALGQLDFRFSDSDWRDVHRDLAAWFDDLKTRPSIAATAAVDDSVPVTGNKHAQLEELKFLS